MYLRTAKRKNGDGSEVHYHQLAENVWDRDKGCAVAKVVYSFGRADELDVEKLRRLARSILRAVGGEHGGVAAGGKETLGGDVKMLNAWPYGGGHRPARVGEGPRLC